MIKFEAKRGKITSVVIACCKSDFHLARLCAASVRYRYPRIPIFLVKDLMRGPFSTAELERYWNVGILTTPASVHGWGFAKLAAMFELPGERLLILDADTVLTGDVLSVLERHSEDLLVAGQTIPDPNDPEVRLFFDWPQLRSIDPAFAYPGLCFNSGQFVANGGRLKKPDFAETILWTSPPTLKHPDVFFPGEQGVLNYVAAKQAQLGEISLRSVDFGRWIGNPAVLAFTVETVAASGYPFVLHWAGPKPSSIRRMQRRDLLEFFESFYYSRIPHPELARRWFGLRHAVASAPENARKRIRKVEKWLRALAKKALRRNARLGLTALPSRRT